jgi:hypothetical protein
MSLKSDVKKDIRTAQQIRPPFWLLLSVGILCFALYWALDHAGKLNVALPIVDCAVALGFIAYVKWDLHKKLWFWLTFAVLTIIHGAVVWFIPWTSGWAPALIAGVIVSVDICLMLWIVAVIQRRELR